MVFIATFNTISVIQWRSVYNGGGNRSICTKKQYSSRISQNIVIFYIVKWASVTEWFSSLTLDYKPNTTECDIGSSLLPTSNVKVSRHVPKAGGFQRSVLYISPGFPTIKLIAMIQLRVTIDLSRIPHNQTDSHDMAESDDRYQSP